MLKVLFTALILLFVLACTPPKNILLQDHNSTASLAKSDILQITIPVREHGYQNFDTQVLATKAAFDAFVAKIKAQDSVDEKIKQYATWNQKENFLDSLMLNPIDFSKYNLLLYRMTEYSGSTVLSVEAPQGTAEHINIKLGRDEPTLSTGDMAYYALAYKVAKSVKTISFDNGIKKQTIQNIMIEVNEAPKDQDVPETCLEWYDGCNDCGRVGSGKEVVCTERHCQEYEQFRCIKWQL